MLIVMALQCNNENNMMLISLLFFKHMKSSADH